MFWRGQSFLVVRVKMHWDVVFVEQIDDIRNNSVLSVFRREDVRKQSVEKDCLCPLNMDDQRITVFVYQIQMLLAAAQRLLHTYLIFSVFEGSLHVYKWSVESYWELWHPFAWGNSTVRFLIEHSFKQFR